VLALDRGRRHHWWPVAPRGRLEVNLQEPRVRFRGLGYHDANAGDEPLHAAFDRWSWSRGHAPARRTVITYGVREHDGSSTVRALSLQDQTMRSVEGVHLHALPRSRWGLEREVWTPSASTPRLLRSLESGPFYGRDVLEVDSGGSVIRMVSEMLSARRLASRTARFMTGFRARREPC
jgi:carotenoid 1,2-hydratase